MIFVIIIIVACIWFFRSFVESDNTSRSRFSFIYKFICLYEEKMGVRLTTDQAITLIQITIAQMSKDPRNKIYLDERYPAAQSLVDRLCAEAENKVFKNHR